MTSFWRDIYELMDLFSTFFDYSISLVIISFKYVRKPGQHLLRNPRWQQFLWQCSCDKYHKRHHSEPFFFFLHILSFLLAIKKQNCELPIFTAMELCVHTVLMNEISILTTAWYPYSDDVRQLSADHFLFFFSQLFRKKWQWRPS